MTTCLLCCVLIFSVFDTTCQSVSNFPIITLFRLNSSNGEIVGGSESSVLDFSIQRTARDNSHVSFLLLCEHNHPIRWIINEDFVSGDIQQLDVSTTYRTFGQFSDPSSYNYTAKYFISLPNPLRDYVFICQNINENHLRSVVLGTLNSTFRNSKTKNFSLRILSNEKNEFAPALSEFDKQLDTLRNNSKNESSNCPFSLNLFFNSKSKSIAFSWSPAGGSQNVFGIPSAQSFANADLFHPQLEEKCINFLDDVKLCQDCKQLSYKNHDFLPHMFPYSLGNERRVLKTFFDLSLTNTQSLYYSWEYVDPKSLIIGYVKDPYPIIYKGQPFTVECASSVFYFSKGTVVAWSFNHNLTGFVNETMEINDLKTGGSYLTEATLSFSRDFLIENELNGVNVSCISPVWNSSEWVNFTFSVDFQDSELPSIINDDGSMTETNNATITKVEIHEVAYGQMDFQLVCQATGIPLPEIEFIAPKNNLELKTEVNATSSNSVKAILYFTNVTNGHKGEYICVAKSKNLGEARKVYEIRILKDGLPQFVIIILIVGSLLLLIFVFGGTALLVKLKREKKEFMRATEEAIKKFREGFKDNAELGFKPSEEYKDYEIPIARWGLGNTMLGSGAFGVVQKGIIYFGDNRQNVVAVKTVNAPKDVTDFEQSLIELTIMSYIGKHNNIVSLLATNLENIGKRSILIGIEYCANGDLLNYIQKRKALFRSFVNEEGLVTLESITGRGSYVNVANSGNFTSLDIYRWALQIANGMDFLVEKKILHCDLAARNVLLTQDNIAKISDFGLSRQLIFSDNYTKKTNSPLPWRWMAIESLKFRQFSSASDIWSYGVTLFEMFSLGEEPWPNLGWTTEFMDELERGRRLTRPKHATENMYNKVMVECWRNDLKERITFSQAREFFEVAITNLNSPEGKEDSFLNDIC